ncbi:uncharacterized protein [Ptychodera flava]|uniref:uncharacterized protein n=1 Tax=Ptychodera flava TaxID=63121 RepID=UPI00396A94EB
MPKSRAEIQRAYRERKKEKEGDAYLAKERERRRRNYIPSSQLNRVQRIRRNEQNRMRLRKHRDKKRQMLEALAEERQSDSPVESSGYETRGEGSSSQTTPLVVKLPFPRLSGRRLGPKRRTQRALASAYRKISKLEGKYTQLQRNHEAVKKRLERLKKKTAMTANSPRSKTESLIRAARLNRQQASSVRKQLLLGNAVLAEVNKAKKGAQKSKIRVLHQTVAGKIVKKYRCIKSLSMSTGFCRNRLSNVTSKNMTWSKSKRCRIMEKNKATVLEFLTRDDNSRSQPGKADAKKVENGEKMQTRVLTDYISNLFAKFQAENPDIKMSIETFRRMRPRYILLTSLISRHSCLCTKHQNMALQMKTLRREGVVVPSNPETFLKEEHDIDDLVKQLPSTIVVSQWKRVIIKEKEKSKSVTRIVDSQMKVGDFIEAFKKQTFDFKDHVERVKTQYAEIRRLKEQLPQHDVIVHMDFAENYSCKTVDEVQSAYWNQVGVTLHPIVVYFRGQDNKLEHQSFIAVSDEMSHSSPTVLAILGKVMPDIKSLVKDIDVVHYWTDSPPVSIATKSYSILLQTMKLYLE